LETVDFSRIPNELDDAVLFLKGHVQGKVRVSKHQLLIDGASHKELKLLLHKFLRHKQLDDYRVLSQSGILELVPGHHVIHDTGSGGGGSVPTAPVTMPYYFPGGSGAISASKKAKKRKT